MPPPREARADDAHNCEAPDGNCGGDSDDIPQERKEEARNEEGGGEKGGAVKPRGGTTYDAVEVGEGGDVKDGTGAQGEWKSDLHTRNAEGVPAGDVGAAEGGVVREEGAKPSAVVGASVHVSGTSAEGDGGKGSADGLQLATESKTGSEKGAEDCDKLCSSGDAEAGVAEAELSSSDIIVKPADAKLSTSRATKLSEIGEKSESALLSKGAEMNGVDVQCNSAKRGDIADASSTPAAEGGTKAEEGVDENHGVGSSGGDFGERSGVASSRAGGEKQQGNENVHHQESLAEVTSGLEGEQKERAENDEFLPSGASGEQGNREGHERNANVPGSPSLRLACRQGNETCITTEEGCQDAVLSTPIPPVNNPEAGKKWQESPVTPPNNEAPSPMNATLSDKTTKALSSRMSEDRPTSDTRVIENDAVENDSSCVKAAPEPEKKEKVEANPLKESTPDLTECSKGDALEHCSTRKSVAISISQESLLKSDSVNSVSSAQVDAKKSAPLSRNQNQSGEVENGKGCVHGENVTSMDTEPQAVNGVHCDENTNVDKRVSSETIPQNMSPTSACTSLTTTKKALLDKEHVDAEGAGQRLSKKHVSKPSFEKKRPAEEAGLETMPRATKASERSNQSILKASGIGDMAKTSVLKGGVAQHVAASKDPTKTQHTTFVAKRVRFTEPSQPLRTPGRNVRLLQLMRRRHQRSLRRISPEAEQDVSVLTDVSGPEYSNRRMLLDELQYFLDGVFKQEGNGDSAKHLRTNSLHSLVRLFLRKGGRSPVKGSAARGARDDADHFDEDASCIDELRDCGVIMEVLSSQTPVLVTIVKRLCTMLGKSPVFDALTALVLVIVFRSTGNMLLVSEQELDALLNAFLRNCALCMQNLDNSSSGSSRLGKGVERKEEDKKSAGRRRGIFARRAEKTNNTVDVLNELVVEAGVVEDDLTNNPEAAFSSDLHGAAYLLGVALVVMFLGSAEVREWMRGSRRLDRVVAILYSADKVASEWEEGDKTKNDAGVDTTSGDDENGSVAGGKHTHKYGAGWRIAVGGAMRVLEIAALDEICQQRLASETRVSPIAIGMMQRVGHACTGSSVGSEWVVCNALKVCINLMQGCSVGGEQFVRAGGVQVVLDCLVRECRAGGLLSVPKSSEESDDAKNVEGADGEHVHHSTESFDVRVLCLALLASAVDGDADVCAAFPRMQSAAIGSVEGGGVRLALEMLKRGSTEEDYSDEADDADMQQQGLYKGKEGSAMPSSKKMERKITIGYVCLLIGALVRRSEDNRAMVARLMPANGLIGIAEVLQEFLEFHHEVGVISASMDEMYAVIIAALSQKVEGDDMVEGGKTADLEGENADGYGEGAEQGKNVVVQVANLEVDDSIDMLSDVNEVEDNVEAMFDVDEEVAARDEAPAAQKAGGKQAGEVGSLADGEGKDESGKNVAHISS